MNKLEIKEISLSKEYANECFFIDDIPLHEHLKHLNKKINLEELTIAWLAPYDNDGDARFMKWLLKKDKLNLPILLCPEDLDFSCTVIIAEIKKNRQIRYLETYRANKPFNRKFRTRKKAWNIFCR